MQNRALLPVKNLCQHLRDCDKMGMLMKPLLLNLAPVLTNMDNFMQRLNLFMLTRLYLLTDIIIMQHQHMHKPSLHMVINKQLQRMRQQQPEHMHRPPMHMDINSKRCLNRPRLRRRRTCQIWRVPRTSPSMACMLPRTGVLRTRKQAKN